MTDEKESTATGKGIKGAVSEVDASFDEVLKRRGTKVAGQLMLGCVVSLGGILYSLSLILVMLNNTQNMGAYHRQKIRFDTTSCRGFLNEQIK